MCGGRYRQSKSEIDTNWFMKHLYIIGNGFDIHHEIPSGYLDFHNWLDEVEDRETQMTIEEIFGYCSSNWWKHFEENLGSANTLDIAMEEVRENYPDFGSDDFSDGDWYNAEIAVEQKFEEAYNIIRSAFRKWVATLPYGLEEKKLRLIKKDSVFINFNYSLTLEKLYHIPESQVLHIHGKSGGTDELVLGHGLSEKEIESMMEADEPPLGEDEEGDDFVTQRAKGAAISGVYEQRKKVDEIIKKHKDWFDSLRDVSYIHFYGHSFADVDLPYFRKIFGTVDRNKVMVEANAHSEEDFKAVNSFMHSEGIKNYKIINITDRLISRHWYWRLEEWIEDRFMRKA